MGVFKNEVERMIFVTMSDIDDRWTKNLSHKEQEEYYKAIIRRLQARLPKEKGKGYEENNRTGRCFESDNKETG